MKKNILIIFFRIFSLLCAFALQANSQPDSIKKHLTSNGQIRMDSAFLIGDRTTIEYVNKVAVIHCYNDSIARLIHQRWNQLIYATHYEKTSGLLGESIHHTFYLTNGDAIYIRKWAKTNL